MTCKGEMTLFQSIEDTTIGEKTINMEEAKIIISVTVLIPISYSNPNNFLQLPLGFFVTNGVIDDNKNLSLEQILKKYIDTQSRVLDAQGNRVKKFDTDISLIRSK